MLTLRKILCEKTWKIHLFSQGKKHGFPYLGVPPPGEEILNKPLILPGYLPHIQLASNNGDYPVIGMHIQVWLQAGENGMRTVGGLWAGMNPTRESVRG